jgi:hypothetical protein
MAAAVNACCPAGLRQHVPSARPAASSMPLPPSMRRRTRSSSSRAPGRLAAVGDVAAEGNTYLIAGAVAVALVGTALPILFSRKDT